MVMVTLDRDGARGSEGEIEQLTLRHDLGANLQTRSGNYEVTVASADTPNPIPRLLAVGRDSVQ